MSKFKSPAQLLKPVFLMSIFITGVIFIFVGINAPASPPANEAVTGQPQPGPNSDASIGAHADDQPGMPVDATTAAESGAGSKAGRLDAKNVAASGKPAGPSANTPGCTLVLLIIGVFGYLWINADKLANKHQSDKILINLLPRVMTSEAGGAFFIQRAEKYR